MRLRILEFVESPNHQAGSEAVPKRVKSIDEYTIAKCEVGWAHTLFLDGKIVSIRRKFEYWFFLSPSQMKALY